MPSLLHRWAWHISSFVSYHLSKRLSRFQKISIYQKATQLLPSEIGSFIYKPYGLIWVEDPLNPTVYPKCKNKLGRHLLTRAPERFAFQWTDGISLCFDWRRRTNGSTDSARFTITFFQEYTFLYIHCFWFICSRLCISTFIQKVSVW